ncbi:tRNA pseudouridine(55) synthase TruB [Alicyclobacillus contaminans]|uniref:tRNA pseudouridine(55) synthase TruB n=1 Tax=Alicyclobacillus contaminans TaxID=392016 RepID=UPI0004189D2A|nr:tRNA pseudouridine(55) synthase TruB [Alicyclobacillus contaminans]
MSVSGVLIVDKPAGLTSHDVVHRVRRVFGTKKVGHAGTLDPDVTGVLVLCVGWATRLLEYAAAESKVYEGTVCFGVATDTDDAAGQVMARASAVHLTDELVKQAAVAFVGPSMQVVPRYSAVHVAGRRAYEYARHGMDVELPARPIEIHELSVLEFRPGEQAFADFRVHCSKGTYIRALCRDWGARLDLPAHMHRLRRVASGLFSIDEAVALDVLEHASEPERFLHPPTTALRTLASISVSEAQAERLARGQGVTVGDATAVPNGIVAVCCGGQLVCVANVDATRSGLRMQPKKVFWKRDDAP